MDFSTLGFPIDNVEQSEYLTSVISNLIFGTDNLQSFDFPSSFPSQLCRRDLETLRTRKYWVTERSAESRPCLLLSMEDGVYLVNDEFVFFSVDIVLPCSHDRPNTNQHQTLLDGVLVHNHHYGKPCFMVIDVIAVSGQRCSGSFSKRFNNIRDVVQPFRAKYNTEETELQLPFMLFGQEYFELKHIKSLLNKIHRYEDEVGARFIYHNAKRYNDNCGLVFFPDDGCFTPWENRQNKFWQWPDLDNVKALIRFDEDQTCGINISTYFMGPNEELMAYKMYFTQTQCGVIHDALHGEEGVICCSYNTNGDWNYQRVVPGGRPTFIIHVVSYLERVANNVTRVNIENLANPISPQSTLLQPTSTSSPPISNSRSPSYNSRYMVQQSPTFSSPYLASPTASSPNPANQPRTPQFRDGSSPGYNDVVYDTPPEKVAGGTHSGRPSLNRTNSSRAQSLASRSGPMKKRAISESYGGREVDESTSKRYKL